MINIVKDNGKSILYGLSTDNKSDAIALVTDKNDVIVFREMDTGTDYVYNSGQWYEFDLGGGGGGTGITAILGEDPELLGTYTNTFTLKDTDYSQWTPSTTVTSITSSTLLGRIAFDPTENDIIVVLKTAVYVAYIDGAEHYPRVIKTSMSRFIEGALVTGSTTTTSTSTTTARSYTKYQSGSSVLRTTSTLGIYFMPSAVTISSSTKYADITSPVVYVACGGTYFTTDAAEDVDEENTILTYEIAVYKVKRGTCAFSYVDEAAYVLLESNPPTPPAPAAQE